MDQSDQRQTTRITLELLSAVEGDSVITQRRLASELGIAVGLVNSYLKRCVKKGLIKVQHVPSRRYAYFLTPKGFAEKSRLTASYLMHSFDFFREARASCRAAFETATDRGWTSMILVGRSDLAEIAMVCAMQYPLRIVALVDPGSSEDETMFASVPVFSDVKEVSTPFSGVLITDIQGAQVAYQGAVDEVGTARVVVPGILAQAISNLATVRDET